jgi:hypothetical protein
MGIEENHDLTPVAAGRVLGCFLGRVFGHWNSRGDLSSSFLPVLVGLCGYAYGAQIIRALGRKPYCRIFENFGLPEYPAGIRR